MRNVRAPETKPLIVIAVYLKGDRSVDISGCPVGHQWIYQWISYLFYLTLPYSTLPLPLPYPGQKSPGKVPRYCVLVSRQSGRGGFLAFGLV